jgi:hypothetical protein
VYLSFIDYPLMKALYILVCCLLVISCRSRYDTSTPPRLFHTVATVMSEGDLQKLHGLMASDDCYQHNFEHHSRQQIINLGNMWLRAFREYKEGDWQSRIDSNQAGIIVIFPYRSFKGRRSSIGLDFFKINGQWKFCGSTAVE